MGYSNFNPIVENAFINGKAKKYGNSQTDGTILLLFGNRIAEHRADGLWITNCGYQTNTTKNHLNKLPNVTIYQRNFQWYLNGVEWDGGWIKVSDEVVVAEGNAAPIFDTTLQYIKTDGWRGYQQPVYAICGANDTGMFSDSPCPSKDGDEQLRRAVSCLSGDIPYKIIVTESSNVFCVHKYVIVPPSKIEKSRELFADYFAKEKCDSYLLYSVN